MSNNAIAEAMLAYLNRWEGKPVTIALELADKKPVSMCMQQLSGTVVEKRYIDGTFIGIWPFAVYVHVSGRDTSQRLKAVQYLATLGEWMEDATLPKLGNGRSAISVEMTALPALAIRYENGDEDYQAMYGLKYKQRSD